MNKRAISCIIVDDEPLAVSLLEAYAEKYPDLTVMASFTNPIDAINFLETQKTDCAFLDVQMPELSGLQFMQIIKKKCLVVLTTAYPEYALDAFNYDVADYLLKPITEERFIRAVNKVTDQLAAINSIAANEIDSDGFFVKSGYKMIKIHYQDILFLEGMRDYTAIHTSSQKVLTLKSMRQLEVMLPSKNFVRVHKSYIINLNMISVFEKGKLWIGKIFIPVGGTFADGLKTWFK